MTISMKLASAVIAMAVLTPLWMLSPGCGSNNDDTTGEEALAGGEEGPYPNIRGGDVKGDKNFAQLINKYAEGKGDKGWAAFWWPYTGNGIASGAYDGGTSRGGGYSPAGKYDAARGGSTQAQSWEVKLHGAGVPKVQGWWGHCNGWCAASALFAEPRESARVNGIEFSNADIKGLLSEAGMSVDADFFGNRVDPWTREYEKAWNDTVPGQYFLVLTNYMGKAGRTVLIDRYAGDQVWNQPLAGYRIKYPRPEDYKGCSGNVCKINIESTIWWYNDSGVPANVLTPPFNWKVEFDPNSGAEVIQERPLAMELWLDGPVVFDSTGKITSSGDVLVTRDGDYFVGGNWLMGSYNVDGHPDYMWVPYSFIKPDPNEDYANPHVDIEWIKQHLLVPGGRDDESARPRPIETAPSPRPAASSSPHPRPTWSGLPIPFPTRTTTPDPMPTYTSTSTPIPFPLPSSMPLPVPRPSGFPTPRP